MLTLPLLLADGQVLLGIFVGVVGLAPLPVSWSISNIVIVLCTSKIPQKKAGNYLGLKIIRLLFRRSICCLGHGQELRPSSVLEVPSRFRT